MSTIGRVAPIATAAAYAPGALTDMLRHASVRVATLVPVPATMHGGVISIGHQSIPFFINAGMGLGLLFGAIYAMGYALNSMVPKRARTK